MADLKTALATEPENPDIVYAEGTTVSDFMPYVWTISSDFAHRYCYRCVSDPYPREVKRCSGCQYAYYCSKECQTVDWKDRHKVECQILTHPYITMQDDGLRDGTVLMFAAIARVAKERASGDDGGFMRLPVDVGDDDDKTMLFEGLSDLLKICDPKKLFMEDSAVGLKNFSFAFSAAMFHSRPLGGEVQGVPGRKREPTQPVGAKLDVPPIPIMAACMSNVMIVYTANETGPTRSVVKALRDIKKDEPLMSCRQIRFATLGNRRTVFADKHTVCYCKACTDQAFQAEQCALKCANAQCTYPVPNDERARQPCLACGTNNSRRFTKAKGVVDEMSTWLDLPDKPTRSARGVERMIVKVMPEPYVAREQLRRAVEVLHPTSLVLGKALLDYCQYIKSLKEDSNAYMEYIPWLKRIIPSIELHLNKYDPFTRYVYYDIAEAHIKRKEYKESLPYIDTMVKRLKIVHPKMGRPNVAQLVSAELQKPRPNETAMLEWIEETNVLSGRITKVYVKL